MAYKLLKLLLVKNCKNYSIKGLTALLGHSHDKFIGGMELVRLRRCLRLATPTRLLTFGDGAGSKVKLGSAIAETGFLGVSFRVRSQIVHQCLTTR